MLFGLLPSHATGKLKTLTHLPDLGRTRPTGLLFDPLLHPCSILCVNVASLATSFPGDQAWRRLRSQRPLGRPRATRGMRRAAPNTGRLLARERRAGFPRLTPTGWWRSFVRGDREHRGVSRFRLATDASKLPWLPHADP